jgi:hypothetical protein
VRDDGHQRRGHHGQPHGQHQDRAGGLSQFPDRGVLGGGEQQRRQHQRQDQLRGQLRLRDPRQRPDPDAVHGDQDRLRHPDPVGDRREDHHPGHQQRQQDDRVHGSIV